MKWSLVDYRNGWSDLWSIIGTDRKDNEVNKLTDIDVQVLIGIDEDSVSLIIGIYKKNN